MLGSTISHCDNAGVGKGALQEFAGVVLAVLDELVVPGHPESPGDVLGSLRIRVRNGADLSESQDALALSNLLQALVLALEDPMVAGFGVVINGGNVALVITGVPVGIGGVAHPHEVVDVVHTGDAVVDEVPELLKGCRALSSPPEPCALGLVEGAKENGDVGLIQAFELVGNSVDIADQESVLVSVRSCARACARACRTARGCTWGYARGSAGACSGGPVRALAECICEVETGGFGIEAVIPRLFSVSGTQVGGYQCQTRALMPPCSSKLIASSTV